MVLKARWVQNSFVLRVLRLESDASNLMYCLAAASLQIMLLSLTCA